jgi:hypothetical protein
LEAATTFELLNVLVAAGGQVVDCDDVITSAQKVVG